MMVVAIHHGECESQGYLNDRARDCTLVRFGCC